MVINTNQTQEKQVEALFDELCVKDILNTPFIRLSNGQQRFVLFMHAIVKFPKLVLLSFIYFSFIAILKLFYS